MTIPSMMGPKAVWWSGTLRSTARISSADFDLRQSTNSKFSWTGQLSDLARSLVYESASLAMAQGDTADPDKRIAREKRAELVIGDNSRRLTQAAPNP